MAPYIIEQIGIKEVFIFAYKLYMPDILANKLIIIVVFIDITHNEQPDFLRIQRKLFHCRQQEVSKIFFGVKDKVVGIKKTVFLKINRFRQPTETGSNLFTIQDIISFYDVFGFCDKEMFINVINLIDNGFLLIKKANK